jgi:hypothetical protein
MASVTMPSALGGSGSTYTDDSDPSTGLANGGHRTRLVPMLADAVAMAESAADSAALALRRNGLINGSFEVWNDATASTSCTAAARTAGPECWYVNPTGAAVTRARSTTVRTDNRARYSLEVVGATSVTTVLIGQRLEAADIPKIKREVTFQAYVYNGSGASFQPSLLLGTPGAADDFTTVTNRLTQTLQSCPDATWTQVSHTVDISAYTNLANGLQVELQIPSGSLVSGDTVRIMEPMLCAAGQVATFEVEPITETIDRTQRFLQQSFDVGTAPVQNAGLNTGETRWRAWSAGAAQAGIIFPLRRVMRAAPGLTFYNPAAANAEARNIDDSADCSGTTGTGYKHQILISTTSNAGCAVGEVIGVHWRANARLF